MAPKILIPKKSRICEPLKNQDILNSLAMHNTGLSMHLHNGHIPIHSQMQLMYLAFEVTRTWDYGHFRHHGTILNFVTIDKPHLINLGLFMSPLELLARQSLVTSHESHFYLHSIFTSTQSK